MQTAKRRRTYAAVVLSAAAHLGVAIALGLYAPQLRAPEEPAGPPLPIIPLLLMPRAPPPSAAVGEKPQPVRLHQRNLRVPREPLPVPPLPAPETPKAVTTPSAGPVAIPSAPPATPGQVRLTLRAAIGCANPDAAGLSREEREACDRRLAAGAKGAAYLGLGLDRGKQGALDRAAAANEADFKYKRFSNVPAPMGPAGPPAAPAGGHTAEEMGVSSGNDRPSARIPF